jgi:C4-dicarboxylate transporter DctQ subunit
MGVQDEKMKFWAVFDRLNIILAGISGFIVVFMMFVVSADVSLRYFFNEPLIWAPEITEVLLLYVAFLGAAWLLKEDGHVRVDIILVRVNPRVKAALYLISGIVGILVCAILIWQGILISIQYTVEHISDPTILQLPKGHLLTIIPVGSLLLLIQFTRNTFTYWHKWRTSLAAAAKS